SPRPAASDALAPAHAHRQAERLQKRSRQLLLASALGTTLAGMREPEAIVKCAADELHRAFGYFLCEVVRLRDDDRVEAAAVGGGLGMDRSALRGLRYAAALHDVGKISIPEAILAKAGALEPAERAIVEGHPLVGERIAGALDTLADVSPVIRHEHERWDG